MRLDKMLADMGIGTRNEIRKACRDGRITVNGTAAKNPAVHIDPDHDAVTVDDEPVIYTRYVYFMLNKPQGVVSAVSDSRMTVIDLIDCGVRGLYPVGRLDRDTEGLLLITNDGPLGHQLLSPKHHVEKEYLVTVKNPLKETDIQRIRDGIVIDRGEKCLPADMRILDPHTCRITLTEGKYHQVKRMMTALDNEVVGLKRIRMKHLLLDETLKPGEYRELTDEELRDLRESEPSVSE